MGQLRQSMPIREDEKLSDSTHHNNGVGFNGVDAPFLSSCAKQLAYKTCLSDKQTIIARKMMVKYCGQLKRIKDMELEREKASENLA